MFLRIEHLKEKKLIGTQIKMSFAENKTFELWKNLMPRRNEIKNNIGYELYSAEVYPPLYFNTFDPKKQFDKWALIEVADFNTVPPEMETLIFPAGLYAVFLHKGPAGEGAKTYQYIFMDWLPASEYEVDYRPHFAVMGEKYKKEATDSEEEIWIPVKNKAL